MFLIDVELTNEAEIKLVITNHTLPDRKIEGVATFDDGPEAEFTGQLADFLTGLATHLNWEPTRGTIDFHALPREVRHAIPLDMFRKFRYQEHQWTPPPTGD